MWRPSEETATIWTSDRQSEATGSSTRVNVCLTSLTCRSAERFLKLLLRIVSCVINKRYVNDSTVTIQTTLHLVKVTVTYSGGYDGYREIGDSVHSGREEEHLKKKVTRLKRTSYGCWITARLLKRKTWESDVLNRVELPQRLIRPGNIIPPERSGHKWTANINLRLNNWVKRLQCSFTQRKNFMYDICQIYKKARIIKNLSESDSQHLERFTELYNAHNCYIF